MATTRLPSLFVPLSSVSAENLTSSLTRTGSRPLLSARCPYNRQIISPECAKQRWQRAGRMLSTSPRCELESMEQRPPQPQAHVPPSGMPSKPVPSTSIPDSPTASAAPSTSSSPILTTTRTVNKTARETSTRSPPNPLQNVRAVLPTTGRIYGTVSRTGTMRNIIAVSSKRQRFDKFLRKHYTSPLRILVHDPEGIARAGDVVEVCDMPTEQREARLQKGWSPRVKHVLMRIVAPFGQPIEERRAQGLIEMSQ